VQFNNDIDAGATVSGYVTLKYIACLSAKDY